MTGSSTPEALRWRKSSHSAETNCVELAGLPGGHVAVRHSSSPQAMTVFTRGEIEAFIRGVKGGEFDDLVADAFG